MSRSNLSRRLVAVVLVSTMLVSSGCIGPFNLTRTVYRWNNGVEGTKEVPSKWMREVVFVALVFLPVYPATLFADAVLFNSIQFWTGDNPIKAARVSGVEGMRLVDADGNVQPPPSWAPHASVVVAR